MEEVDDLLDAFTCDGPPQTSDETCEDKHDDEGGGFSSKKAKLGDGGVGESKRPGILTGIAEFRCVVMASLKSLRRSATCIALCLAVTITTKVVLIARTRFLPWCHMHACMHACMHP